MSLGFVFPGQGAQAVGMASEFLDSDPCVRERLAEANDALGFDLAAVILSGPEARLAETALTQPALLVVGIALWQAWRARGGAMPVAMAGHSLGEYTALTAAGAIAFADAVRLVHARGRFMQEASPVGEGAMAAIIGLDDDQVMACCEGVAGVVQPANLNAPGQVVISGAAAAVAAAADACKAAGARRAVPLNVSGPFHCELMRPAAERLREALDETPIQTPDTTVLHNVNALPAEGADAVRSQLMEQLCRPVRWSDCARSMGERGVERMVECGPGNVLAGLMRRIDKSIEVVGIGTRAGMEAALQ